jgi:hypothetical protein
LYELEVTDGGKPKENDVRTQYLSSLINIIFLLLHGTFSNKGGEKKDKERDEEKAENRKR